MPPRAEQKRIADKLDALLTRVAACRERLDRVPGILRRFRQSVLSAATSGALTREWRDEEGRDDDWPEVSLADVASGFSYGSAAKSAKSGKVPVLRMGNIQNGRLDWTDLVYTSDAKEIAKYALVPGDVLFNRTNSPDLVGKTAVFNGECQAVYAGYLIKVRCGHNVLPDFLNYSLSSPRGRDYCWRVKSDGVSQSNINAKKLAAYRFRLPPVDEQREIVRRVEEFFAFADACSARANTTSERVASISASCLAMAFRGELVPQDPDDEPAAELFTRMRTARATEEKTRPKRGGERKARIKNAPEVAMLTRSDVKSDHLSAILKKRGPLTAEGLWKASQLDIDDFYEQLREEELLGLLCERRGKEPSDTRLLEPTP